MPASYLDNDCRLRTRHYVNWDDFEFPIMNFPFICSNIFAAPVYGVYISLLIRYSRDCGSYQNFRDRELLTSKLLNQWLPLVKLKSLLRKFYCRHHNLFNRYGIYLSQMPTDMFRFSYALPGS